MNTFEPCLNHGAEFSSMLKKFRRFGGCGNLNAGIVNHVALATTSVKEQDQLIRLSSERKARALETESMMPWNRCDTISRTSCRHTCHLQSCVIGGREPAVLRERRKGGIGQISFDYGAKLIEFLFARLVRVNLSRGEQSLPTHPRSLSALSFYCAIPSARNGCSRQSCRKILPERRRLD